MDSVCVINLVLASNGKGGRTIVSEPLWESAGPSLKRSPPPPSTSWFLLIQHPTPTNNNPIIPPPTSMDPLHTTLAGDLVFWPYDPANEEDNTAIWSETAGHAQSQPEFSLGGATTVSAALSGDTKGLLTHVSFV